jgi:hypothetical protein
LCLQEDWDDDLGEPDPSKANTVGNKPMVLKLVRTSGSALCVLTSVSSRDQHSVVMYGQSKEVITLNAPRH